MPHLQESDASPQTMPQTHACPAPRDRRTRARAPSGPLPCEAVLISPARLVSASSLLSLLLVVESCSPVRTLRPATRNAIYRRVSIVVARCCVTPMAGDSESPAIFPVFPPIFLPSSVDR